MAKNTTKDKSPLADFIEEPLPDLGLEIPGSDVSQSALESYARNTEELKLFRDLVRRVRLLDHAYIRLFRLGPELKGYPQGAAEILPKAWKENQFKQLEIEILISFIFNEIKTILDLLEDWLGFSPAKESELYYCSTIQNFCAAHPRLQALMRGSSLMDSISESGPVSDTMGSSGWEHSMLTYYLGRLGLSLKDRDALKQIGEESERIIRGLPKNDPTQMKEDDSIRLKLAGIRMPQLEDCFLELAEILQSHALTKKEKLWEKRSSWKDVTISGSPLA